jgi:hypothetical protein
VQILEPSRNDKVFVLYLPMNEIHELGLMYLNYEVLSHGYKTIYLGESVPTESLSDLNKYFDSIVFVAYMTVQPDKEHVNDYIKEIQETVLKEDSELWLIGRMIDEIKPSSYNDATRVFKSISDLVEEL